MVTARAGRLLLLALCVLAGWAPAVWADYKESYKKGIEAADRKEWGDVARWMRQALNEQSREGEPVKIYGVRFEPYLPHYYLGLALFNAGDCEGALNQWEESERQGAVQGTNRHRSLVQSRDTCQKRLAASRPQPTPTPPAGPDPAAVAQAAREAEARKAAAAQAAREKEAADKLARQREEEEARRRREEEALRKKEEEEREAARLAAAQLEAENQEKARRQTLGKEVERAAADARGILDRAAKVPTPAADLRTRQTALRDLLRRAGAVSPGTSVADLERLRREIPTVTSRLEEALLKAQGDTSGPPAELRAAARAFFRADHQEVVRTLATSSFNDRRATLAGNLLLAAARYSLYLQGGEKDTKLREQALENVRVCRRLDSRLKPDPKAFSPRFAEFFRSAG
jgi:hypothetical protein